MSISTMKRLTVLTPKGEADALVRRLMKLRCVEIRSVPLDEDGELLRHDCDTARVEAERRVNSIAEAIPVLDKYTVDKSSRRGKPINTSTGLFRKTGSYHAAWAVADEVLELRDTMTECYHEDNRMAARIAMLCPWLSHDLPLEVETTDTACLWLGVFPAAVRLSAVEGALADLHAGVEEVYRDQAGFYAAVMFHKADEEAVNRGLVSLGFVKSNFKDITGTAKQAIRAAEKKMDELDNRLQGCIDRLCELSPMLEDLQVLYDVEKTTLLAAQHKQKLAETESCVILEGWVPTEACDKVKHALRHLYCAYDLVEPEEGEEPPVLLKNNGYASNFEWVLGMYAYPKYGSYDPTFIMSIYYFVIFGLMFADVGYGLLLTLGGFLAPKLLNVSPGMKRMLTMFGYCGIACTILGAVFGGWFGDLPYAIMTNYMGYESVEAAQAAAPIFNGVTLTLNGEPLSLNPLVNPVPFLIISLAMGLIHIVGGMAVKFYMLCREGKIFSAIFDIGSYWILFGGLGLLFVDSTVGLAVTVMGVLMIVLTQGREKKNIFAKLVFGLKGLYDLINYASDLLSYSRILALGLAAGVMAQVFNLLGTLGGVSVPGFILLIFVMLIGHGLNMAINLLGAFVHTCRLQYLEFFSKFYEDGGTPFDPALPSEKYSTAESESNQK
ncbi:MAG: hypothetical protein E7661_01410 [Ruminococcaceae bacterium]|nr:hypothetical protein [Oscillospiraceae bacterium]